MKFFTHRFFTVALLFALGVSFRSHASLSYGPATTNAVDAQLRQKMLFDQAVLSQQEKLRVARERYARQQADRAQVISVMNAQVAARQQVVTIPAQQDVVGSSVAGTGGWIQSAFLALLVVISAICAAYIFFSRKQVRER